jgi:hypothetical protein
MPKSNKKNRTKTIFTFFSFIALTSISLHQKPILASFLEKVPVGISEAYDPALNHIQSVQDLDNEVRVRLKGSFLDTSEIVNTIDDVLRDRFYHSYSEYSLRDNWVAFLCSKIYWGIKHPVIPDDILHYPMAACSQQGLVFQAMLDRYGITYATTAFGGTENSDGGHYTISAYYQNSWHFFDSNQEPIKIKGNPSIDELIKDNVFVSMYPNLSPKWLQSKVQGGLIKTDGVNEKNGMKMFLFQSFTNFLSSCLWVLPFVCYLRYYKIQLF